MKSIVGATSRKPWPCSALVLMVGGALLLGMGLYFIFLRPALLPEDLRFIGIVRDPQDTFPRLALWLSHVFWVLGSYMITAGVFTCYVAATTYRRRARSVAWLIAATGTTSIGVMMLVNFSIDSDFKWVLASFTLLWVASLWLYYREKPIAALTT